MREKNLDFDRIVDRKNTNSLKYDFAEKRGEPRDVLPLWVADMDFKVSSHIQEALERANRHGIFGYSETAEEYFEALRSWMSRRHGWEVQENWLVKTPGVVFALALAIRAYTKEGEAVLIQSPVYYPFAEVIVNNDRKLVTNELVQDFDGSYKIDFSDFERKIVEEKVKLFILCSPHNPVGRVWTREELQQLGDICREHNVIVVSDEIHADFAFGRKHNVFTTVRESFQDFGIVCTSPSKTFNMPGLQVSNIFIANPKLREGFCKQLSASGYSQLNLPGIVACEAAYRYGEEWLDAVLQYISENAAYVEGFLKKRLPKVKVTKLEGTYLMWVNFRACGLTDSQLEERITYQAKLWLDSGRIFGTGGEGFQRINIACPRSLLAEGLERLAKAFQDAA